MEWVRCKVYEHGFWKGGAEQRGELEVFGGTIKGSELTAGTIDGDGGDDGPGKASNSAGSDLVRRWVRIARCYVNLAGTVDGFHWTENKSE